jgi:hypothetical protein
VEGLHGGDHTDERGVSADELVQALLCHLLSRMVGESGRHGAQGGARAGARGGGAGWRRGARGVAAAGHAGWQRCGKRALAAGGGRELVGRGKGEEERRAGLGDLGFWVKFDDVHVAHVFQLKTWVPTFLIC